MKVLVTGSRGFIGSVLILRGQEQGHKMVGLDDYSRGLNDVPSINWDCRQGVSKIFDEFTWDDNTPPFDCVVHLAAGTGSLSRPYEELVELNVEMTHKIYEDTVKYRVKVFVFPTTSLIEGVPESPYVRSKQTAMDALLSRRDGVHVVPLQLYNVAGGYRNCSEIRKLEVHIIPIMVDCFMQDKPFIINGDDYTDTVDGTPGRDFSNVCDVADFMLYLTRIQLDSPFRSGGVIKVGTGVTTTAKQMVQMFNEIVEPKFGKTLKYEIGPRRAFDCAWLRCDQPYLNIFKAPTLARKSLEDEVRILLDC